MQDSTLRKAVLALVNNPDAHVRFQFALSLGSLAFPAEEKTNAIVALATNPDCDSWQQTALLSSVRGVEVPTLRVTASNAQVPAVFVEHLAGIVGKSLAPQSLSTDPTLRELVSGDLTDRKLAIIRGL